MGYQKNKVMHFPIIADNFKLGYNIVCRVGCFAQVILFGEFDDDVESFIEVEFSTLLFFNVGIMKNV